MMSPTRLWPYRRLFASFFARELSSRYVGSIGGGLWALVQPVLLLAIYSFVFRVIFKVRFPELAEHSFVSFVACALWPWMAFQEGLQRATHAIAGNASLIKKVAFPSELLIYAAVASTFVLHLAGFAVVLAGLELVGERFHLSTLPLVTLAWATLFVMSCALAFVTASLQVFLKDVEHMLGPILMVLFYATPILYPMNTVPEAWAWVMRLNPLAYVLDPLRTALLQGTYAPAAGLALSLLVSLLLALICKTFFNRLSPHFEDFA